MSGWGWAGVIVIGWLVVGFATAPLVARRLKRLSQDYPEPGPEPAEPPPARWEPPVGPCVPEPEPEPRSSTPWTR